MGASMMLANVNRSAAIVSDGASRCANRIKIDDVETAMIAMNMAIGSRKDLFIRLSYSNKMYKYTLAIVCPTGGKSVSKVLTAVLFT